jgi:hypothetical protein
MPYHVEIESRVLDYLGDPDRDLSVEDIDKLLDFLETPSGLAGVSDEFRNDPSRRCAPGSPHFEERYIFRDSAGRIRQFRLSSTMPPLRLASCASSMPMKGDADQSDESEYALRFRTPPRLQEEWPQ